MTSRRPLRVALAVLALAAGAAPGRSQEGPEPVAGSAAEGAATPPDDVAGEPGSAPGGTPTATPTATSTTAPTAAPTGEVWTSPLERRAYRAWADAASGAKWLEDSEGRRFESTADAVRVEESRLPRRDRVLAPSLRAAADALAAGTIAPDTTLVVVLRLASQPLADAAERLRPEFEPELLAAVARRREILSELAARRATEGVRAAAPDRDVDRFLTADERQELEALRLRVLDLQRGFRRDVIAAARVAAAPEDAALARRVEAGGGRVVGRSLALHAVTARVPVRDLDALVRDVPSIARMAPAVRRTPGLNVSVPVVGASTWWSQGYDGSTSTRVAILDTGIDSSHPTFTGGVVADAEVFLTEGSNDASFDDDASSTDDFHFHGTHVGGTVAGNDSTYKGVAPGARLLNAKCGYNTTDGGGSLADPDIMEAGDWAADQGADVFNCSFGGSDTTDGSSDLTHFFDAIVADLGISVAISAGNSGPSSNTVGVPGDGFNVVTVANFNDANSTSTSDDSIASSSSRGPLDDGRRKPDIAAPGTNIVSSYAFWEGSGSDYVGASGTSMAAPHVAGALAILVDGAAAAHPAGLKALLVTNARNTSPVPTSPGNTWGYGAMDLGPVWTNVAAVHESSLTSSGPQSVFLRGASLASGKRVSLVWDRRVVSNGASAPTTYSALLDLDLAVYDESDGSSRGTSASSLNSVEQVALSAAATTPVIKVRRAASFASGVTSQAFAVAAEQTSALTAVSPPSLACTFATAPTQVAGATNFTVTVNVANSGGLAAQSPAVTLTLPSGYSVVSGSNPQTIARVAASASGSATWTVRSSTGPSATKTLSAAAASSSYGDTFSSATANSSHLLDVDAPSGTVTAAGGAAWTASRTVSLALTGTDSGSGVAQMRVRDAAGSWGSWTPFAATASVTLTATDGAHTVEAQFMDAVGNVSASATDAISLDTTGPAGGLVVAGGAAWTASRAVTLTPSATDAGVGVADMSFSDDGAIWSAWTPFAASAAWTLPAGDGSHTVYARFRDTFGNVSATASDAIGLDTAAPSGTVSVAAGAAWSAARSVTLTVSGADAGSGVSEMSFSDDGASWSSWAPYAATAAWTLPAGDGSHTVHARFRDAVGIVSATTSDAIGLDETAPSGTIVPAVAWTASRTVAVALAATDATSGVAQARVRDAAGVWGAWAAFTGAASATLETGDGTHTVEAQFMDAAGNVSASAGATVGLDTTGPSGSITVAAGAAWTGTRAVTLSVGATDGGAGVSEMSFSDDGAAWSSWAPYAATAAWTLPAGDGGHAVYARFRDAVGNVSASVVDSIGLDTTGPSGTVVAASGAAWISTADVPLTLSATDGGSGVAEVRLGPDGTTWGTWAPYATSAAFTLTGGDGVRTVWAQFRDAVGNESAPVSDGVGLDRLGPTGRITIQSGDAWTRVRAVTLSLNAGDTGSGVAEMAFAGDDGAWTEWMTYGTSLPWTLSGDDGARTVSVRFRDAVGNVSGAVADTIGLDTTPPSGAVTIADGAFATSAATVALSIDFADAGSGVDAMRFSTDGATWGVWKGPDTFAWFPLAPGEGTRAAWAQFRDAAGNISTGTADEILADRTPPVATVELAGGRAYLLPGAALAASAEVSDGDAGSGADAVAWSHDGGASWSEWAPWDGGPVDVGLPEVPEHAPHEVLLRFRDAAGNESAPAGDSIFVLPTDPQDCGRVRRLAGRLEPGGDVDLYRVDLLAGDRIDVTLSSRALATGGTVRAEADLCAPDGTVVASGRWPEGGRRPGIRGFAATETGTWFVVVRASSDDDGSDDGSGASYTLSTRVRTKATPRIVGAAGAAPADVAFVAAGRALTGRVTGPVAADATIDGPEGASFPLRLSGGRRAKWAVPKSPLVPGAGTWTLHLAAADGAAGPVSWNLRLVAAPVAPRGSER